MNLPKIYSFILFLINQFKYALSFILLLLTSRCILAQSDFQTKKPVERSDTITIADTKHPMDLDYVRLMKGLRTFEEQRQELAPSSVLKFRIVATKDTKTLEDIRLKIKGDTFSLQIPLDADKMFDIPFIEKAQKESAGLMANKRAEDVRIFADVRTPGLPKNTRRLGDLRLQCFVNGSSGTFLSKGSAVHEVRYFFFNYVASPCNNTMAIPMVVVADYPVFSITLRHQAKEYVLKLADLYSTDPAIPHLQNKIFRLFVARTPFNAGGVVWESWPDDTLVTLEPMIDLP